jgi:D-inositol-3-phosphate glycosyltransferase
MKILFYATYPTISTGYSRIGNILSNYLAEQNHDIYYFGISNFKGSNVIKRYIHPNIKLIDALEEEKKRDSNELYGVNVIIEAIQQIKPDIVFLYNDIIVISRIINNFIEQKININFKTIVYLDLVYEYEKIELIDHVNKFSDLILVFSECWKKNLIKCGIKEEKIEILPHGFDDDKFYPIDKYYARKKFNFLKDDFIVLNSNRNSYRKSLDKTIDAFLNFLKIKNNNKSIKLFLNTIFTTSHLYEGYDIINLIKVSCLKYNLIYDDIINNHIFINPSNYNSYSDDTLNLLYNASDIGINTCSGEGFGLCNLEHGGIGRPQIISNVGALGDIFTNDYSILINPVSEYYITNSIDFHGGYLKICNSSDFTDALIKYYDNRELLENHGRFSREKITTNYEWNNILKLLNNNIDKIYNELIITREEIKSFLIPLTVYSFEKKIRLGVKFDGGYIIGNLDDTNNIYDCYISCGISKEESFSRDFILRYGMNKNNSFAFDGTINNYPPNYTKDITFIKKNINNFNDDCNDNLLNTINNYNSIFLKMDIEGGEYNWLVNIKDEQLDKFKQIVIEFHGLGTDKYNCLNKIKFDCLSKLSNSFYIIHVHANNYENIWHAIPRVLEITYINKKYIKTTPQLNKLSFPIQNLDYPNCENVKDIILDFYPYKN